MASNIAEECDRPSPRDKFRFCNMIQDMEMMLRRLIAAIEKSS